MKARWKESESLTQNVQRELPRMAEKWFAAGEAAMAEGVSWEEMHQFRLLTKRFRYTLEIFEPQYGPSLRTRIDLLRDLQTHLGEINDCVTTETMLPDDGSQQAITEWLHARAKAKTGELRKFWQRKFAGPAQVASWTRYLARYANRVQSSGRKSAEPVPESPQAH